MNLLSRISPLKKSTLKLFIGIIGILSCIHCSPTQNTTQKTEMERRVHNIPVRVGDRFFKSGIFIEFPFQKYSISFDQFYNKQQKYNDQEKVLKDWFRCFLDRATDPCQDILRNEDGSRQSKDNLKSFLDGKTRTHYRQIIGYIPMGQRSRFVIQVEDDEERFLLFPGLYARKGTKQPVSVFGGLPFYEAFVIRAFDSFWTNSAEYPVLSADFIKDQGSSLLKYVPITDPTKGRSKQPIAFYLKGQPFYMDVLDPNLDETILKKFPALEFYRDSLKIRSSGTLKELLDVYMRPDSYKRNEDWFSEFPKKRLKEYQQKEFKKFSHIRFVVDADPVYLVFVAITQNEDDPKKEKLAMVTIHKNSQGQYKIANDNYQGTLWNLFFESDFRETILNPMIAKHRGKSF